MRRPFVPRTLTATSSPPRTRPSAARNKSSVSITAPPHLVARARQDLGRVRRLSPLRALPHPRENPESAHGPRQDARSGDGRMGTEARSPLLTGPASGNPPRSRPTSARSASLESAKPPKPETLSRPNKLLPAWPSFINNLNTRVKPPLVHCSHAGGQSTATRSQEARCA